MVADLPVVSILLPDYKLSVVGIYRQHHGDVSLYIFSDSLEPEHVYLAEAYPARGKRAQDSHHNLTG